MMPRETLQTCYFMPHLKHVTGMYGSVLTWLISHVCVAMKAKRVKATGAPLLVVQK